MRLTLLALIILTGASTIGCTQARRSTPLAEGPSGVFKTASPAVPAASEYRVAPPDHLKIKAQGIKELDSAEDIEIRADGRITLNLVGEVYVAGRTPSEISKMLDEMIGKYYVSPDVQVEVTKFKSKTFEMFGEVRNPGSKPFTGNDTVLKALATAGFTDAAWPQQVSLSRPPHPPQQPNPESAIVDLKYMFTTGDTKQNYVIQEGDIIQVPKGPLTEFNRKLTLLLGPITGTAAAATIVHPPEGN